MEKRLGLLRKENDIKRDFFIKKIISEPDRMHNWPAKAEVTEAGEVAKAEKLYEKALSIVATIHNAK